MANMRQQPRTLVYLLWLALTWIAVLHYDGTVYGVRPEDYADTSPRIELVVPPPANTFRTCDCLRWGKRQNLTQDTLAALFPRPSFRQLAATFRRDPGLALTHLVPSPIQPIITVLHKQHIGRQSSDNEPPAAHSSLS